MNRFGRYFTCPGSVNKIFIFPPKGKGISIRNENGVIRIGGLEFTWTEREMKRRNATKITYAEAERILNKKV